MIAYSEFIKLCASADSEERGRAAYLAALSYVEHTGPADEHAALYAALVGFLDDPSARVRGALAYGLLHTREAPRAILVALLQDAPVIARAIAQYSPALIDMDLLGLLASADSSMLMAVTQREKLSQRLAEQLIACGDAAVVLKVLARHDVTLSAGVLRELTEGSGATDARLRGALLARKDLPGDARMSLVDAVSAALRGARLVNGSVAPNRLDRVVANTVDSALTRIGENESRQGSAAYAERLVDSRRLSTRVLLRALINGHLRFFAECVSELSGVPRVKAFGVIESGARGALAALLGRCGFPRAIRDLLQQLIQQARSVDLADDLAARHFVITAVTEALIVENEGVIPLELEEAFAYLSEQNVGLARRAARGVMAGFVKADDDRALPLTEPERLGLAA